MKPTVMQNINKCDESPVYLAEQVHTDALGTGSYAKSHTASFKMMKYKIYFVSNLNMLQAKIRLANFTCTTATCCIPVFSKSTATLTS
jgi:hypothetical protein